MKSFLIFAGGLAIGAGASWLILKNKYEEKINEEYREAREYKKRKEESKEGSFEDPINLTKETVAVDNEEAAEIEHIISNNRYASRDGRKKNDPKHIQPFVISPDEFGIDLDTDTLYYHNATADGETVEPIIANGRNEEINDVEDLLGMSAADIFDHFGEYEEDCVYIRNPQLGTDYEILRELADFEPNN